jgi:rod shape-determining protein MreC
MKTDKGNYPWYAIPFVYFAHSLENAYMSFSDGVRGTTSLYLDLVEINKENRILKQSNSELKAQLSAMQELKLENERLNSLLDFQNKNNMELLPSKVIAKDLMPDHQTIVINRGTQNKVKKDMAVISTVGVVGYVVKTLPTSSQVLMLNDRYAVIDAIVQRSRTRSLIEGTGSDFVRLNYLRRDDDVQTGDLIVTSGFNNLFPKGLPIGTVAEIKKDSYGVSQKVVVEPAISKVNLEEVFVILNDSNSTNSTKSLTE